MQSKQPSRLYLRLKSHTTSKAPGIIAFAWGLLEATFFFIVPDIYLGFVGLFRWQAALLAVGATVLGAVVGGLIMYSLAGSLGDQVNDWLQQIPLITPSMIVEVSETTDRDGLIALVTGPLQGIPYKIYAVQAGLNRLPLLGLMLMTIPARLMRILPVTLLSIAFGLIFRGTVERHTSFVVALYLLLWVAIYVLYFLQLA